MKLLVSVVTLVVAFGFSSAATAAEPFAADPSEAIRSFYRWYVTELIANHNPMENRKELKRFATGRLLKEIDRMKKGPDGLDGDYFVDAQDFDPLWAKSISISAVQTNGNKCNAQVLLDGSKGMRKKLSVHLAREGGSWKVDRVQGRDGD